MIKSLSIIFPVFNEELRLKSSFRHIKSFLKKKKKFNIEIIFVDDGSEDNSYYLIDKFIKGFKKNNRIKLKVIKSKTNLGKGSALKLGVKVARNNWILTTDIDMSVSLFQVCRWLEKKLKIEIIFVDDGSEYNSYNLINKFINNFKTKKKN